MAANVLTLIKPMLSSTVVILARAAAQTVRICGRA
jgi:hypothetical protein